MDPTCGINVPGYCILGYQEQQHSHEHRLGRSGGRKREGDVLEHSIQYLIFIGTDIICI